jgi:hypothetical protein
MSNVLLLAYLEKIAAIATAAAEEYRNNRMWEGDMQKALAAISESLQKAQQIVS